MAAIREVEKWESDSQAVLRDCVSRFNVPEINFFHT